jgi:parallel beta-helix repeat protein
MCRDSVHGVYVCGHSAPDLVENECANNDDGIVFFGDATGTVMGNLCYGNLGSGIFAAERAKPIIEHCVCSNNKVDGITYRDKAAGQAVGNTCSNNVGAGISIGDEAAPELADNACQGNSGSCISVEEGHSVESSDEILAVDGAKNAGAGTSGEQPDTPDRTDPPPVSSTADSTGGGEFQSLDLGTVAPTIKRIRLNDRELQGYCLDRPLPIEYKVSYDLGTAQVDQAIRARDDLARRLEHYSDDHEGQERIRREMYQVEVALLRGRAAILKAIVPTLTSLEAEWIAGSEDKYRQVIEYLSSS